MGIYIVAMAALFFLGFAFFAVGQAAVVRNSAQTAADSAALAAARADRDAAHDAFLSALRSGDLVQLGLLLQNLGQHDAEACAAASAYAGENNAAVDAPDGCGRASGLQGYTVSVTTLGTVGTSVIDGTEAKHAKATATAVVEPRCGLGDKDGNAIGFICNGDHVTVDPTAGGFVLDLSTFYTVHLSK
ncbi:pilus assembly protein TadG-related protein [Streptomyces sp. NPDC088197]|uniref:pilus assembly protein TadG-related protein n=1 Tax=Streptomyces sp. NPDC088197 TaxID=3365840 RepID=UPI003815C523